MVSQTDNDLGMWTHVGRYLAGGDGGNDDGGYDDDEHHDDGEHHSEFGVHITYEDLYKSFVFLVMIYVSGLISRWVKMPSLVGEILCGIYLGPPLFDFVPNPEAWVKLGEIGLVLLVVEAGIDIDVATLKLIGKRGLLIAIIGSILPIILGIGLAILVNGMDIKAAIAAGSAFGPTSLGIALNILRSGGVLNTPVGQLIVSAAVIDDMIALIVLSQLESLKGTITIEAVMVPVIAAVAFLVVGGYLALFVAPGAIERFVLTRTKAHNKGKVELGIMFVLVLLLMPATYYGKASYLMGAFIAGLTFCTSHELHHTFVTQFKRLLQWMMRVFFAASIGFQVPMLDLGNMTVIWQGLIFTLALTGKLAVGFLVPNFTQSPRYTGTHLRDCLITGLSMAAEGEFAFVIAVFAVDNGLISKIMYASVVWAILLSTIIPPFLLRTVITYYNRKAEDVVRDLAMEVKIYEDDDTGNRSEARKQNLVCDIRAKKAVFMCIQTYSDAKWGLIHKIMATLTKSGLDIIDHRSWHPRGIQKISVVNEIYVKDTAKVPVNGARSAILERMESIQDTLQGILDQELPSTVKVSRWYPGVATEIADNVPDDSTVASNVEVERRLLEEAALSLERSQSKAALEELGLQQGADSELHAPEDSLDVEVGTSNEPPATTRRRRKKNRKKATASAADNFWSDVSEEVTNSSFRKHRAELLLNGKTYTVVVDDEALQTLDNENPNAIASGSRGHGVNIHVQYNLSVDASRIDVVNQLEGFIRTRGGAGRGSATPATLVRGMNSFSEIDDSEMRDTAHNSVLTPQMHEEVNTESNDSSDDPITF